MNWGKYIGIHYRDCNCFELVRKVQDELFAIKMIDYAVPFDADEKSELLEQSEERNQWHQVDDPQPGDIVLMNHLDSPRPRHVAVYVGDNKILHTTIRMGSHMADLDTVEIVQNMSVLGFYRRIEND